MPRLRMSERLVEGSIIVALVLIPFLDELAQLGYLFNCPSFVFAGRSAPPQLVGTRFEYDDLGGLVQLLVQPLMMRL